MTTTRHYCLLNEDGSFLLNEDGTQLLCEDSGGAIGLPNYLFITDTAGSPTDRVR